MRTLVEGIDHVFVPMVGAAEAFGLLVDDLALPVLWPFRSFGGFASGGVSVGSIKLELLEATATAPFSTAHDPPEIQGIAFRPSASLDRAYLAELDARSISRSEPAPFVVDGELRWTNVYLPGLISETTGPFLCDYHVPGPRDLALRRRVLEECGGGRLGVVDALELVVVSRDAGLAQERWERLLGPPTTDLTWRPAVGPAIRLVEGPAERVDHLTLGVRRLEAAQQVWSESSRGPLRGFPLELAEPPSGDGAGGIEDDRGPEDGRGAEGGT